VVETKRGRKWKRRKKGEGIACWNRGGAAVCGRGEGREEKERKMGRRSCCPPKERREKERKEEKKRGKRRGRVLDVHEGQRKGEILGVHISQGNGKGDVQHYKNTL